MAVEIYRILNDMGPRYLSQLFSKSSIPYQLRDDNKLIQPLKRTTSFGIKSFAYFGTHLWNMLPQHIKNSVLFQVIDAKMVGSYLSLFCMYTSCLISLLSL